MNWVGLHTRSDRENLCGFSVLWNGFEKRSWKELYIFENVGPKLFFFVCICFYFNEFGRMEMALEAGKLLLYNEVSVLILIIYKKM